MGPVSQSSSRVAVGVPHNFKDDHGVRWTIREYVLPPDSAHQLIFECDGVVRRVRTFPENWRDLDCADLQKLSWNPW